MTYKTKKLVPVIAFAAILLAWPMATPNAQAELVDASLGGLCGFTTGTLSTINFGSFVRTDSESGNALEETITFAAAVTNTESTRVSITVEDWKTVGTHAFGTIEIVALPNLDDEVEVGAKTYVAKTSGAVGDQFNIGTTIEATALNLATAIRASDAANYKVSTAGTAIVTVNTVAKNDNDDVLSEDTVGARIVTKDGATSSTSTNVLNGGTGTKTLIIDGENTKFAFSKTADPTGSYASKTSTVTLGTAQEVLGSTTPANGIFFAIEIDPATATYNAAALPYSGPIEQEITISVEAGCDGT